VITFKRQKVVIFGGPDRCGKTTIARELSRVTGIPYFKAASQQEIAIKRPEVFEQQTRWAEPRLYDFIMQTGCSVIMDRGFPCDWCYSHALGRKTAWGTLDQLDWDYGAYGLNALLVVTVRRDYSGLQDDAFKEISTERLWALDELYRHYAEDSMMCSMDIETDDADLHRQVDSIVSTMKEIDK
jgi:hypothetical protein